MTGSFLSMNIALFVAIVAALAIVLILTVFLLFKNKKITLSLDNLAEKGAGETIQLQSELETAREQAAIAVSDYQSAQQTMSTMFESNPHINVLFDSSFNVVDCNPIAIEFMGFDTKEELLAEFSKNLQKGIPAFQPDGRPSISFTERFTEAAKHGHSKFQTEIIIGSMIRNLDIELKKIPYENGFAIVAYVYDLTDIHEREMELKRIQELSEKLRLEAEAANKAKSAFLSTMSHEIRTPLNAILGITEIQLQNDTLDQSVIDAFGKIYISGDLLLGIINDILDLSKIEAGKLELIIDNYEIASMISDTAQLNMMRIGSKPIEFELEVDENTPTYIFGDELRVKQILNNILSNAFKYTNEGTVKLSVSAIIGDDSDDIGNNGPGSVSLVFSISDTGQGMTDEQVNSLFDEYSRFNQEANRETEGTGLGMSITRNLVRLMNGKISIESEPGKGSTFTVLIPQGKNGPDVLGSEMAENLRQFRSSSRAQMKRVQITREPMPYGSVLIVDDVETNIYVARGILAPYGLMIDTASSGYEAIEKIRNGNEYDIIFMDHMMPGMDGIEATKIIRELGYKRSIVALTANAVAGQADIFLGNGFNDFISKPIDIRQLNTVLNKLVRDKQPHDVVEAARQNAANSPEQPADNAAQLDALHRFAEVFLRDAHKSLAVLDSIMEKGAPYSEDDVRTYIIHVHGLKSALANIGKMDLSAVALKLEMSARDGNTDVISSETSAFLDSLRAFVDKLEPVEDMSDVEPGGEDTAFLRDGLHALITACDAYDKKAAKDLLSGLREKKWPHPAKELLDTVSEHLLHSDFDDVIATINRFLDTQ